MFKKTKIIVSGKNIKSKILICLVATMGGTALLWGGYNVYAIGTINSFLDQNFKHNNIKININDNSVHRMEKIYNQKIILHHFVNRFPKFITIFNQQNKMINLVDQLVDHKHSGYISKNVTTDKINYIINQLLLIKNLNSYDILRDKTDDIAALYIQTKNAVNTINKDYNLAQNKQKVKIDNVLEAQAALKLIKIYDVQKMYAKKVISIKDADKQLAQELAAKQKSILDQLKKAPFTSSQYDAGQVNIIYKNNHKQDNGKDNNKASNKASNKADQFFKNINGNNAAIVSLDNGNLTTYYNDKNHWTPNSNGQINTSGLQAGTYHSLALKLNNDEKANNLMLIINPNNNYYGQIVSVNNDNDANKYFNTSLKQMQQSAGTDEIPIDKSDLSNMIAFKNNQNILLMQNNGNNKYAIDVSNSVWQNLNKFDTNDELIISKDGMNNGNN